MMIPIFSPWRVFSSYVARDNSKDKRKRKKLSNTSATLSPEYSGLSLAEMSNTTKAKTKTVKMSVLLLMVSTICSLSYGQRTPLTYNMAIGFRGAYDIGINYRQFLSDHIAIEGLISHELNEPLGYKLTLTAQYQRNAKIVFGLSNSLVRIAWYVGAGTHVAYYKQGLYPIRGKLYEYYPTSVTPVGIDGVVGLEYRFKKMPLAIGVDARSYYEIYKPGDSFFDGGAFVRYVFD